MNVRSFPVHAFPCMPHHGDRIALGELVPDIDFDDTQVTISRSADAREAIINNRKTLIGQRLQRRPIDALRPDWKSTLAFPGARSVQCPVDFPPGIVVITWMDLLVVKMATRGYQVLFVLNP